MRTIAHSQIRQLSLEFSNPERAAWLMRDFLNKSLKKTNQTLTKNLLLKVKTLRVGFEEVEDIAEHLLEKQKGGTKKRSEKYAIVKDLMKHIMADAEKCLKVSVRNLKVSKDNLTEVVRVKTVVREEFMYVVDREVSKVWKDGKKRVQNKANHLAAKYVKDEPEPAVHKGVIVGDELLEELETKKENKKDNLAPIYGDIQGLTEEHKEILSMPPNHRTYPKLNLEDFKTDLHKCVVKATWQKMRYERNQENKNKDVENDNVVKEVSKE